MADITIAVDYVLRQEDATLSGKVTVDAGGRTRFGIAERFHPELTNSLFYSSMGSIAALQVAKGIYEREYCQPLSIADITDQDVANLLLSLGINCGARTAAKMLQVVLGVPGDGNIGPITMDKLDNAPPADVIDDLRTVAAERYREIAQAQPGQAKYLSGWLNRIGVAS